MKILVDSKVLEWTALNGGGNLGYQQGWDIPYKYLELAERISHEHTEAFQLVDLVANLKRAINHRIQKISRDYQLKKLNGLNFPQDALGKLEALHVVRPTMLEVITSIRNQIEHGFKAPPTLARCNELLDLTWYFLKSTDEISRLIPHAFSVNYEHTFGVDSRIWLVFDIAPFDGWRTIGVYGRLLPCHLTSRTEDALPIKCTKLDGVKEVNSQGAASYQVHLNGICEPTTDLKSKIIQLYFEADALL